MGYLNNNVLVPAAQPTTYDNTSTFVRQAPGQVLGYVGHGTNAPGTPATYLTDASTGLQFATAQGAIFETWESYNAWTFQPGVASPYNQGQLAQWIARGGTAGVGNVAEPGATALKVTNEDLLFAAMLEGFTFGEAAWMATPQLSYVNTVIGDPLMVWKQWLTGDANLDGKVDASDILMVKGAYGTKLGDAGYNLMADMDANGIVDLNDLLAVKANYTVGSLADALAVQGLDALPEPGSLTLVALGAAMLVRRTARHRRSRR
jgi:hypothetical protein